MITTDRGLAGSLNANAIRAALRWTQERADRLAQRRGPRRDRGDHDRPQGPRRPAPRRDPDRRALHPARRPARLHRRDAHRAARDRGLPRRRSTTRSTSSTARSSAPSPSGRRSRSCCRSRTPEQAEGRPRPGTTSTCSSPRREAVLGRLLPHFVAIDLYRAVLENQASEQSARMIAMRNSTDNANELIDDLVPRLQQDAAGNHHPRDDRDRLRGRSPGRLTTQRRQTDRWRPER